MADKECIPKSAGPGAATGFARKNGVTVDDLTTESTPRGEYYALHRAIAGRETSEILAEALPALIARIPWPVSYTHLTLPARDPV